MIAITAQEAVDLKSRHSGVFHRPFGRKLLAPFIAVAVAVYLVFCFFFFNVAGVITSASWERAGTYIADWYSWEANPRFRFKEGQVELEWTRSLLGENPDPDWIERTGDDAYTVILGNPGNRVEISTGHVVAVMDGRSHDVAITDAGAELPADAPSNMSLKSGRVTVDYGFVGLAEIRNTQVFVRHRFIGWPNFFFNTHSPFFGMNTAQLWASATAGDRIDERMPNWQLMLVEFLYNVDCH